MTLLLTLQIRYEQDVVLTRQRARQIAELLGFDAQDQTRLATAVSEIVRNALRYARGGTVEFSLKRETAQSLMVRVQDQGPGIANLKAILEGRYISATGMGLGIIGTKRLMDQFQIESIPRQGTTIVMEKSLPKRSPILNNQQLEQIRQELTRRSPQSAFEEIQRQNQELLRTMAELRRRDEELTQLNRELEDTNRGVVALYAELDEKAVSLQKANELKTRFLSNMSHEFRTPLNSIVSLSRLLLDRLDGPLTGEQEKQITFIQQAAAGLSELVNDLLDLAKVEAGKTLVQPSAFEVTDLFGTLRGMLRPLLANNAAVALIFEEPVGIPTLYTDEGKVAQILRNFISNALKFTEQGEVRVSAFFKTDTVTFSVADTGIGIAPDDQERIFEDFIQVDSALQKKLKGTGLGLPLSRKLAELLGGSVFLVSEVGKGSQFSVSIPVISPQINHPQTSSQSSWQLNPSRIPILAIEDDHDILLRYHRLFERSTYQLLEAETLEQAKQALQNFTPAAVILDILLKEEHTWSFLSEIKSQPATCTIPILVVTVVNNEKQVRALGADDFLIKPVDGLLLLNRVNTLVKRGQPPKLLLIDDDLAARYVLKQYLHGLIESSPEILEAADGQEGLQVAQVEQPQVIVLDLTMPGVSGSETLKQLKQNPATRSIPVIINTSKLLEPEEQQFLTESSVAILSKEMPSQDSAIAQLRQALLKAGVVLDN